MSDSVDKKKVMVVGGGFAGMTAALLLAEQGCKVVLVEKEAAIGGFFPLLDNTFPTNSCGVCFLSPRQPAFCPFVECRLHDNLQILVNSEPVSFRGEPGAFTVKLRVDPRGVDQEKCLDCGQCSTVCPVTVPCEFSGGLEQRPAIYKQYPKMVRAGYRIDFAACTRCGACVEACPTGAIDLEMPLAEVEEQVDAILLTPGFSLVDGGLRGEYGFGRYANVITSRQMERLISGSGPTSGRPRLPGSGAEPRKVAFIQCVGSRDISCGRGYCSSVCCMYATKQAMFLKEKVPAAEITIFYMDIRGVGKDYERYFNRARGEYGINYQRSLISTVKEDPQSGKLRLMFADQGRRREAEFDLVVLSLGFDPPQLSLGGQLSAALDAYGFCRLDEFQPARTSVPGIYAAGAFTGPKDVPETVMEAAGAADVVVGDLGLPPAVVAAPPATAGKLGSREKIPRVGVFLCRCHGLLTAQLDLSALEAALKNEPRVVSVAVVDAACQPEGREAIREICTTQEVNRLVMGGCSVRELERQYDDFAGQLGIDPAGCAFANLREQCSYVHADDRQAATAKARSLLQAAVTQVVRNEAAAPPRKMPCNQGALVVGGGVAGMTAALSLAGRGFPVTLLEKEAELGGRLARESFFTLRGGEPRQLATSLRQQVEAAANITVCCQAEVVAHRGRLGDYQTTFRCRGEEETVNHGVLLLATGGREAPTAEYLHGQHEAVLTQVELETRLAAGDADLAACRRVVMIQCVGSREAAGREYCSRVCCTHALKNALKLKEINPALEVLVLYRDLRAYGLYEDDYRRAREAGILFTTYEVENKPQVQAVGDGLRLSYDDQILGQRQDLDVDLLVLSVGIVPNDVKELAGIFNLPLDDYGFYQEANSKAALVDFVGEGRYHCGLGSAPLHINETLIRARAAAVRAAALLVKGELVSEKTAVTVSTRLCSGCGLCVEACPYGAREIDPDTRIADVHYDLCHGCGSCAAVCPNGATQQMGFAKKQVMAVADRLL